MAEFPGINFTESRVEEMRQAGVRVYPVELHAIRKGYHCNKVIMGYGNLTEAEIEEGVARMKMLLFRANL